MGSMKRKSLFPLLSQRPAWQQNRETNKGQCISETIWKNTEYLPTVLETGSITGMKLTL